MHASIQKIVKSTVTYEAVLDVQSIREALELPEDSAIEILDDGAGGVFVRARWQGAQAPAILQEKPAKGSKKKPEEPAVAPPPVDVDWAAALKEGGRPTVADLKKAEEDAGPEKIAAVRGKLSLGAGVTCAQIGMQSNAREYFDALRADALGAK